MKELHYKYDNIFDFYKDALTFTKNGDIRRFNEYQDEDDPSFRGLSKEEILKSKYNYQKGLDRLKELQLDIQVGGSKRNYKYDEFDGDDINYDRLLDGFPPMRKRIKNHGVGSGRLVNIYVIVSENCDITSEELLYKANTAIQIVDMLENMGYRVAVYSCDITEDSYGQYQGEQNISYQLKICVKKHEDSLNKGLILTSISPWFFRYYMFIHQVGHYNPGGGLGHSVKLKETESKETIIINKGQCLNKMGADKKINEIKNLFKAE